MEYTPASEPTTAIKPKKIAERLSTYTQLLNALILPFSNTPEMTCTEKNNIKINPVIWNAVQIVRFFVPRSAKLSKAMTKGATNNAIIHCSYIALPLQTHKLFGINSIESAVNFIHQHHHNDDRKNRIGGNADFN